MKKKSTIFIFLLILMLTFLTGCGNKMNSEDAKTKAVQELDYLDTQIISISNKLNNIILDNYTITSEEVTLEESGSESSNSSGGSSGGESSGSSSGSGSSSQGGESGGEQEEPSSKQESASSEQKNNITITKMESETVLDSDENDIDWSSIKNEIDILNEAWGVIILDLSNLNVENNNILDFSSTLNDSILSIKDENKIDTLNNISKLYSFIPKFEKDISSENGMQNVKQAKSYVINAYALVEQENWSEIESNISECEQTFKNVTNNMEYIKDKEYKINRTYVLIKELQNSLTYKDKKLFYVKYKNLMESINTI